MDYEIPLFVLKMVQIYFSERLVCRVYRRSGGGRMSFLAWRCTVFAKGSLQPKLHRTRLVLYTHDMPYIYTHRHTHMYVYLILSIHENFLMSCLQKLLLKNSPDYRHYSNTSWLVINCAKFGHTIIYDIGTIIAR